MNTLSNVEWVVFEGLYFNYHDKPESKVLQKEQNQEDKDLMKLLKISSKLFEKCFGYLSRSDMYKAFNETTDSEENKAQVNSIENRLVSLMEIIKSSPTSDAKKLKIDITCWKLLNLFFTLID